MNNATIFFKGDNNPRSIRFKGKIRQTKETMTFGTVRIKLSEVDYIIVNELVIYKGEK